MTGQGARGSLAAAAPPAVAETMEKAMKRAAIVVLVGTLLLAAPLARADMGMGSFGPQLGGDDMIVDDAGKLPAPPNMVLSDPGTLPAEPNMVLDDPGKLPREPNMALDDPGRLPPAPQMDIERPQDLDRVDDLGEQPGF
jgi:hypothetical protein